MFCPFSSRWPHAAVLVALLAGLIPKPAAAAEDEGSTRWEKEIAAFEQADKTNPPPQGAILFVGSSSIRMWKTLDQDFARFKVIRRGFGGSQIADSIAFAHRIILPYQPRLVLLYAGDNDIAAKKSPEQVLSDFKKLTKIIHQKLPETKIAFIAIKPSLARWPLVDKIRAANELVKAYAATDKRVSYIDIFHPMLGDDGQPRPELFVKDGLHMNEKGYQLWTSIIRPYLK